MNMLEEVRAKWCDILENLLECPVCYEIPQSYIYQCLSGHHICHKCRTIIIVCPICERLFSSTRNYLAEALSVNLTNIMTSLMYPTHKINRCILQNKICVYTQTEDMPKESVEVQTQNIFFNENKFTQTGKSINKNTEIQTQHKQIMEKKIKQKLFPTIGKGVYPCRIGCCTRTLSHGGMIQHLKSRHTNYFYIFQENNGQFRQNCKLEYVVPRNHDLAFLIKNMGLFFINIAILPTGDLTAVVFIVNNASASKQFLFELTIGNGEKSTAYVGMVRSCRASRLQAMKDSIYKKNVEMNQILYKNNMFNCTLSIKRRSNLTKVNHDVVKHEW